MHPLFCISADDASRVILSVPDAFGSDYINASFIDVRKHAINFPTYIPVSRIESTRVWHIKIPLNSYIACITDQAYYLICL